MTFIWCHCFPGCVTLIARISEPAASFVIQSPPELYTWTSWAWLLGHVGLGETWYGFSCSFVTAGCDGSSLPSCPCKQQCSTLLEGGAAWWKDEMNRIWCPVWRVVYIYIHAYIHVCAVPGGGLIAITQEAGSALHDICAICQLSKSPIIAELITCSSR